MLVMARNPHMRTPIFGAVNFLYPFFVIQYTFITSNIPPCKCGRICHYRYGSHLVYNLHIYFLFYVDLIIFVLCIKAVYIHIYPLITSL